MLGHRYELLWSQDSQTVLVNHLTYLTSSRVLPLSTPARWGSLDFIRVTWVTSSFRPSSPFFLPTANSRSQCALPDLNCELQISVGTAGPQPRAPDLSAHCRTSTASSRSQWALPDLNRELQISVRTAGPQLRAQRLLLFSLDNAATLVASAFAAICEKFGNDLSAWPVPRQASIELIWAVCLQAFHWEASTGKFQMRTTHLYIPAIVHYIAADADKIVSFDTLGWENLQTSYRETAMPIYLSMLMLRARHWLALLSHVNCVTWVYPAMRRCTFMLPKVAEVGVSHENDGFISPATMVWSIWCLGWKETRFTVYKFRVFQMPGPVKEWAEHANSDAVRRKQVACAVYAVKDWIENLYGCFMLQKPKKEDADPADEGDCHHLLVIQQANLKANLQRFIC